MGTTNPGTGLNLRLIGVRIRPSFPPIALPIGPDQLSGPVVVPSVKEMFYLEITLKLIKNFKYTINSKYRKMI